ncbi:MAG: zinc-ribbon domain-containing protein [Candidatus Altiarchaeota archaeon]
MAVLDYNQGFKGVVFFLCIVIVSFVFSGFAIAQQDCALGHEWSRRVVGCIQSNCDDISHAFQNYVLHCVCYDCGERGCTGDIEFSKGCHRSLDYKSCPGCLYACISPDGMCPGEKPTQKFCDDYCVSYHGPHEIGEPEEGSCDCECEEGYTENENLLCIPTPVTCTTYCNEYHGTDKAHGEQAVGTPSGVDCDCECAKGYAPDESLTCQKVSCEEECKKKLGEGGIPTGTHPECGCKCDKKYEIFWTNPDGKGKKKVCIEKTCPDENAKIDETTGECVCPEPKFEKKPWEGICIEKREENPTCGDKYCDYDGRRGEEENCQTCVADCFCEGQEICAPDMGLIREGGCIKSAAEIIDIGCFRGTYPPQVAIKRFASGRLVEGKRGTKLVKGDLLSLSAPYRTGLCTYAYINLRWSDGTRAKMMLGDDTLGQSINIGADAVESGWPSYKDTAKATGDTLWSIATNFGKATWWSVAGFFSPSASISPGLIQVYVKSHIIINQSQGQVTIYTLEGEPIIGYLGRNVTVDKGKKVSVTKEGVGDAEDFPPFEPGDWYLKIPDCPPDEELVGDECVSEKKRGGEEIRAFTEDIQVKDDGGSGLWLLLGGGFMLALMGLGLIIVLIIVFVILKRMRKVRKEDPPVTVQEVQKSASQGKFCTECGAPLDRESLFCTECGAKQ